MTRKATDNAYHPSPPVWGTDVLLVASDLTGWSWAGVDPADFGVCIGLGVGETALVGDGVGLLIACCLWVCSLSLICFWRWRFPYTNVTTITAIIKSAINTYLMTGLFNIFSSPYTSNIFAFKSHCNSLIICTASTSDCFQAYIYWQSSFSMII